ncbi:hypothetical protein [Granulicella rosea]|nr:hypothetical protein [Granulicella rosea]
MTELQMPKFQSEKEEAEWWDANPNFALQVLERAKGEGTLGHGTVSRRAAALDAAKQASIALDPVDIAMAARQSERKGLDRQTYLKALLHEALLREEESQDQSSAA